MLNNLRGPKKGRPRLKLVKIRRSSRHRTNPAPRRRVPPVELPPSRKRTGGQPAREVNFALLHRIFEPAALRPIAPRQILRTGKVVGNRDGAKNGKTNFRHECCVCPFSLPACHLRRFRASPAIFAFIVSLALYEGSGSPLRVILGSRTYFSLLPDPGLWSGMDRKEFTWRFLRL